MIRVRKLGFHFQLGTLIYGENWTGTGFTQYCISAPLTYFLSGDKMVFHSFKLFCVPKIIAVPGISGTVCLGISCAIILYCYFRIFKTVRHHNNNFRLPGNPVNGRSKGCAHAIYNSGVFQSILGSNYGYWSSGHHPWKMDLPSQGLPIKHIVFWPFSAVLWILWYMACSTNVFARIILRCCVAGIAVLKV